MLGCHLRAPGMSASCQSPWEECRLRGESLSQPSIQQWVDQRAGPASGLIAARVVFGYALDAPKPGRFRSCLTTKILTSSALAR